MKLTEIKRAIKQLPQTAFGISVPQLRKLARQIAKEDYKGFVENNPNNTFELQLLHAFVIGYAKDDIDTLLRYFKAFVPQADSWGLTDSLCQNFKIARKYPQKVWDFIMRYKHSRKEFESRIVSVMLLSHFLTDKYIDQVIEVLNELHTDEYYSQMGVAWALATIIAKYPQKGLDYLEAAQCKLDRVTYRKTLQKIRESFRVSDAIKHQVGRIGKKHLALE
ncbi:MAG: DNA alkylation repair protein [Elusimicrobiaceae bacterium]|nr:DNA alkylation repair protein [Elusimicrobiaceae bacterium]